MTVHSRNQLIQALPFAQESHVLYVPIGPSGAGKSTFYKEIHTQCHQVQSFSLDSLRAQWYPTLSPQEAWKKSRNDETFYPRAQAIFKEMVGSSSSIYLDSTNLTPEKRKFYVQTAKEQGYTIIGIVFSISMEVLIKQLDQREAELGKGSRPPNEDVQMHLDMLMPPQKYESFDRVFSIDTEGTLT